MITIDNLVKNNYSIEFTKINLINSSGKLYEGKGNISQNSEGELSLKMYSYEANGYDFFNINKNTKSGKFIPNSKYYKLSGIDIFGHVWKCDQVDCSFDIASNHKDIIITSSIHSIYKISQPIIKPKRTTFHLKFRKNFKLPLINYFSEDAEKYKNFKNNSNFSIKANFLVSNYEFVLTESKYWYELDIYSKKERLNEILLIRVCEALQFITSTHIYWTVFEKYGANQEKIEIRSTTRFGPLPKMVSPLNLRSTNSSHIWKLFSKYLEHILIFKEKHYHPLSSQIYKIIQSSGSALEIQALTTSVAIEHILKKEISKYCSIENKIKDDVNELIDHIQKGNYSDEFTNRIPGLISSTTNPRAVDYLRLLVKNKLILKKELTAWKKIRNSSAHADSNNSILTQKYLNLFFICLMLFYKLVFLAINYQGNFTDISEYGWKTKKFNKSLTRCCT